VLPEFADFHRGLNHDKANLAESHTGKQWSQRKCSRFSYYTRTARFDLDFLL